MVASCPISRAELGVRRAEAASRTKTRGSPTPLADDRVLDYGPVLTPDGSLFQGGCRLWAIEEVHASPSTVQRKSRAERYVTFLEEALAASSERQRLWATWSRCMAEAGHSGLDEPGDHIRRIDDKVADWEAERITYEAALDFDIAVTTQAQSCFELIEADQARLRNEIVADYLAIEGS